jgi:hypothetical protein
MSETTSAPSTQGQESAVALALSIPRTPSPRSARVIIPLSLPFPNNLQPLDFTPGPQELHLDIPTTVYSALFTNGLMLNISCANAHGLLSVSPPAPHLPPDLQPTAVQLSTPHARWIDRFPFPRMRDNFIALAGVIDQELFLGDLFCLESFVIKAGGKAWVGVDWKVGEGFGARWGFLFC